VQSGPRDGAVAESVYYVAGGTLVESHEILPSSVSPVRSLDRSCIGR
jgi:hypothetical protein